MKITSKLRLACIALTLAVVPLAFALPSRAETEKRIAFVVGNTAYQAGPLATPANDAGLIAQTLQAAGFDVTGARDLDGKSLRAAFKDFLDKAQASGPDTVAFVYLAGYGLPQWRQLFCPGGCEDCICAALPMAKQLARPVGSSFAPMHGVGQTC